MLPAEHAQMLAATLDVAYDPTRALPLLWHWAYFNPRGDRRRSGLTVTPCARARCSSTFPGACGSAGRSATEGLLRTDIASVRRTRLLSHARKQGSTGDLLVVTLEHTVEQGDRTVIVERQDVIYRQAGRLHAAGGPAATLPPAQGWRETVMPTTMLLFRFSAVTFNGHRIHYDHDYATEASTTPTLSCTVHSLRCCSPNLPLATWASHCGRSPTAPRVHCSSISPSTWTASSSAEPRRRHGDDDRHQG